MKVKDLKTSINACIRLTGYPALSFWGENGLSEEEIVKRFIRSPWGWVRVSTVGRLKEAGFPLRRTPPRGHLQLRFTESPTDETLEKLVEMFDEPIENPHSV